MRALGDGNRHMLYMAISDIRQRCGMRTDRDHRLSDTAEPNRLATSTFARRPRPSRALCQRPVASLPARKTHYTRCCTTLRYPQSPLLALAIFLPARCVLQSAPHPVPTSTDLAWCPTSWGSVQRLFSCCRGCRALLACSSAPWAVPRFARLGRPWPPPSIDTWRSFPSPLQPNAHAKARIRNSGVE